MACYVIAVPEPEALTCFANPFAAPDRAGPRSIVTANSLSAQLRIKRSELMADEIEDVALRLFDERGLRQRDGRGHSRPKRGSRRGPSIATSPPRRTSSSAKSTGVLKRFAPRSTTQPADQAPLRSLRLALVEVVSAEDATLLRRWTGIVAITPSVLPAVIGGIQLKSHTVIAEYLADRLQVDRDSMIAITLAAATGGVIQAAHTYWFVHGGHLATRISSGLEVLERALETVESQGADLPAENAAGESPGSFPAKSDLAGQVTALWSRSDPLVVMGAGSAAVMGAVGKPYLCLGADGNGDVEVTGFAGEPPSEVDASVRASRGGCVRW